MTNIALRGVAVAGTVLLLAACRAEGPVSPTRSIDAAAVFIPPGAPQPSGPLRSFAFDHQMSSSVSEYTKRSIFDLYDNGAFVLEFPTCTCPGAYRGTYRETGGTITFEWEGTSTAGPWGATGVLQGDVLTVRYNMVMQMSDFEDAVYRRVK